MPFTAPELTHTNISYNRLERDQYKMILSDLQKRTRKTKSSLYKDALKHYYLRAFPNKGDEIYGQSY